MCILGRGRGALRSKMGASCSEDEHLLAKLQEAWRSVSWGLGLVGVGGQNMDMGVCCSDDEYPLPSSKGHGGLCVGGWVVQVMMSTPLLHSKGHSGLCLGGAKNGHGCLLW